MLPSKLLSCLIAMSMFLLIFSSAFLIQFSENSFTPRSMLKSVVVNCPSVYFNPNVESEQTKPSFPFSTASTKRSTGCQENGCQISNYRKNYGRVVEDRSKVCDPDKALLRVYMYDLPPEFHFGLLGWSVTANQTWPNVSNPSQIKSYPGGLNLQHSMEYWLTLDLLYSSTPNLVRPCSAMRVHNSSHADIIFVPFFSSISYNKHSNHHRRDNFSVNRMLQDKLVDFLKDQDEWKRSGGKDHLIMAHHPNSMLVARRKLGSAIFLLADFGRCPVQIANLEKDVIAPYKHIVRTTTAGNSAPFEARHILVYFQGAIHRKNGGAIRQELYYLLKDEKDVHFKFGTAQANGFRQAGQGMASSKFCLSIAGDTPSSNHLFDAIASHCVPVIISDEIELPFEDVLDYTEFCIFVRASNATKKGYLLNLLRAVGSDRWTKMWERLKEIAVHFEYQFPSQSGDAVDMIWQAVSRKISSIRLNVHRKNRYQNINSY